MVKRVAIVQSNYIPWKGYFDLIRAVDEFVLYDDVQYTKCDWRNRNGIKTPKGIHWLTIPVRQVSLNQSIFETRVVDGRWRKKHWETIRQFYGKARYFSAYQDRIEQLYHGDSEELLSRINERFLRELCEILGIRTRIRRSDEFRLAVGKTERLVELCEELGAQEYLSGPAARCYLDESLFTRRGIAVRFADYSGYPEYGQFHPPFEHGVTVLDLLFHQGPGAVQYLKDVAAPPLNNASPPLAA